MPLVISSNLGLNSLATHGDTSTVGEPAVAANGASLFVTGNWYASRSSDEGGSWTWVDPANTTPGAAGGFCCDQLVLYDRQRQIWIWLLQYVRANGTNVFRIAVSSDGELASNGWHWWDIAPAMLDSAWTDVWFDYPDSALSAENLYVTFNIFRDSDWQRAAVMRFPLDTLRDGGNLAFGWWSTTDNGSLRLTQQAAPTAAMYWGSHNSTSQLRLFSWPDGSANISSWNIDVRSWSQAISSSAPNGVNWLGRCDNRITAACLGDGVICFMWTAGADSSRPHPYCRVVRIDENTKAVRDQPDIFSNNRAWAYPAACVNSAGTIGFTAFYGGGGRNPGHIVGARDENAGGWRARYARQGSHAANQARWGDYLTCQADGQDRDAWVASGFTLEGGSERQNVVPRVVRFSLQGAQPVTMAGGSSPVG